MSIGFIFPGQGAQNVGMGKSLYERSPEAKAVFEQADSALNEGLSKIMFEGPEDQLTRTNICQPAIFVHSMAALAAIQKEAPQLKPQMTAGLSLGEYSALCASGAFSFEDGLRLVKRRGELMQKASDETAGGLVSVMGLDLEKIEPLAAECGLVVANLNAPDQIVVAGKSESLDTFAEKAKAAGAKRAMNINVAGAFHSPLMNSAAEGLKEALTQTSIQSPQISVYANVTGKIQASAEEIRANLENQVNHITRWRDCCDASIAAGVTSYVEIGPGKVLKGLMRKINREASVVNVDDAASLDTFLTSVPALMGNA